MNLTFWLIASAMVLLALLIVLPPLWRKHGNAVDDDLDQRNIKIARDRLAELKANKAAGGISQDQYDEQVAELELALSDDLDLASLPAKAQTQGRWLVYVLVIAIPCISALLYWKLGDYQAINRANDSNQVVESNPTGAATPSPEAINKMVAGLAEKLKKEPNNLKGWLMLGRSYLMLQRYPEAVKALDHAQQLAGDNVEVLLTYAEAQAQANNGTWAGKPYGLISKALAIDPNNLIGLWFAAMANAQQGDKKTAVDYLRKLDALLPADSPEKQRIHELVANTERQLGKPAQNPSSQASQSPAVKVDAHVSLSSELQAEANKDDTVFIYAQALSGPKMPLAIIRKQVSDLPLSVSLSDADSMLPNMKLSNFKQIKLLARISKSGNAMPQAGDLIGAVENVNLTDRHPYKIVISDRVK